MLALFKEIFEVPLKETPAIVLAVASFVAVAEFPVQDPDEPVAFPVRVPVTSPVKLAFNVPLVTVKFPVLAPVKLPVPIRNLSEDSSQPIKALDELPLSITIPESPLGAPDVPLPSSIILSLTVELAEFNVVVVPLTVKLPPTVMFPVKVLFPAAVWFTFPRCITAPSPPMDITDEASPLPLSPNP